MAQCPICQRQFNKDRLEKHQAICEKSSKKKRKVFDPVKMRVKGTESEGYLRKLKNKKPEKEVRQLKVVCRDSILVELPLLLPDENMFYGDYRMQHFFQ